MHDNSCHVAEIAINTYKKKKHISPINDTVSVDIKKKGFYSQFLLRCPFLYFLLSLLSLSWLFLFCFK